MLDYNKGSSLLLKNVKLLANKFYDIWPMTEKENLDNFLILILTGFEKKVLNKKIKILFIF